MIVIFPKDVQYAVNDAAPIAWSARPKPSAMLMRSPRDIAPPRHRASEALTLLAVECSRCAEYSERPLTWLRSASTMRCDKCGGVMDLTAGESRRLIDGFASLSERLDAEFYGT